MVPTQARLGCDTCEGTQKSVNGSQSAWKQRVANDLLATTRRGHGNCTNKSKQYGWDCSKVNVTANTDCSSLVRTCVAFAAAEGDCMVFNAERSHCFGRNKIVRYLDRCKVYQVLRLSSKRRHTLYMHTRAYGGCSGQRL